MKPPILLSLLLTLPILAFLLAFRSIAQPSASSKTEGVKAPGIKDRAAENGQDTGVVIRVWKIGSPHTGDTPDTAVPLDLDASAEKLGYDLKVESFPAEGFAEKFFEAYDKNQEPDILVIDNYGMIDGIKTARGKFTGIGSSRKVRQSLVKATGSLKSLEGSRWGWEFLIRGSRNYEAAKSLGLRLEGCGENAGSSPVPHEEQGVVERLARAYLEGQEAEARVDDPDRLRTTEGDGRRPERAGVEDEPMPGQDGIRGFGGKPRPGNSKGTNDDLQRVHVRETATCGYWGNGHVAFASVLATYEAEDSVGWLPVQLIVRSQQGQWKTLVASTDPVTSATFGGQIAKLGELMQRPWKTDNEATPAKILAPEDGKTPVAATGERDGNFEWESSGSGNVAAEIVEFAYKNDARLYVKFRTGSGGTKEQISAGQIWYTRSVWRWRVWSLTDSGAISFSESRSFPH
jgi:hypothetical protein